MFYMVQFSDTLIYIWKILVHLGKTAAKCCVFDTRNFRDKSSHGKRTAGDGE